LTYFHLLTAFNGFLLWHCCLAGLNGGGRYFFKSSSASIKEQTVTAERPFLLVFSIVIFSLLRKVLNP